MEPSSFESLCRQKCCPEAQIGQHTIALREVSEDGTCQQITLTKDQFGSLLDKRVEALYRQKCCSEEPIGLHTLDLREVSEDGTTHQISLTKDQFCCLLEKARAAGWAL